MSLFGPLLLFFLASTPEQRAVEYLSHEVPNWNRDNHCHSCHNNGDAARALFLAARRGYPISRDVVVDTVTWLSAPPTGKTTTAIPASATPNLRASSLPPLWRRRASRIPGR